MPRLPRPTGSALVFHAINRGNNRAAVFHADDDRLAFLAALAQTQRRYPFLLYSYCLMTNHFHLLLQPAADQTISRILQSLTVAHTCRYHRQQRSSGHVWQGRFKSPVVQCDEHARIVLRYIEANPVRAGLVADPADYRWSSFAFHALGQADPLLSSLPGRAELAPTEAQRQQFWRRWVRTPLKEKELHRLRQSLVSGQPFGSADWVRTTAAELGLPLATRPRGRPRKQPTDEAVRITAP